MTNEQVREIFNSAADAAKARGDQDALAKIELAREFFTNPAFAKALADYTFAETYRRETTP